MLFLHVMLLGRDVSKVVDSNFVKMMDDLEFFWVISLGKGVHCTHIRVIKGQNQHDQFKRYTSWGDNIIISFCIFVEPYGILSIGHSGNYRH